nr:ABC transporter substrate-binding protein [uncultured Rhodopila sp.]
MYLDDVGIHAKMGKESENVEWHEGMNSMHLVRCRRRGLLAASAAFLTTAALPVYVAATIRPAHAADDESVVQPIQQLVGGLIEIMKAGTGTPFAQRFETLAPIVDRTFDLPIILQESVGSTWASLPQDQQDMLMQAFRRYTVSSYVNSFNDYKGQRFDVKPGTRPVGNGEQVVQTRIIPKTGDGHELDYVMRQGSEGWRAVDVLADGSVSRVAVQRSDFRRLLARGGAEALAKSLRTKSADLSGGSS